MLRPHARRHSSDHFVDSPEVDRFLDSLTPAAHATTFPSSGALALLVRARMSAMLGWGFERWSQWPALSRTMLENDALAAQASSPCTSGRIIIETCPLGAQARETATGEKDRSETGCGAY